MRAEPATPHGEQPTRFLLLYALAYAGGFVAYVPFLTIILPIKVAAAAGDGRIEWLATATLAGAIAASIGNVAFGWASDLTRSRRPWIAAGLIATLATYAGLLLAETSFTIAAMLVLWQLALNMMLSPLAALAADRVPDHQKGRLGGLLGAGPPIGALAGILVTLPGIDAEPVQIATICLLIGMMVAPLLWFVKPAIVATSPPTVAAARTQRRIDLTLMWLARLLIQIAGSTLFGFLLYFFQSIPGDPASPATVARVGGATLAAAVPLALLVGRASDKLGVRRPFLIGTALVMAAGLLSMATARGLPGAVVGYALFGCCNAVFLALHSVYAMQMLPSPAHRGRDLGLFNLTNTLPSILSPLLAIALVPTRGFGVLMVALAIMAAVAALLMLLVRDDRVKTA